MNRGTSPRGNELLSLIQHGFPIESRPFLSLAERTGRSEADIIAEVKSLIRDRTIREFGPVFDPGRLGYLTTLIAARIEADRAAELSAAMLPIVEITHNYYREGEFNLWFTIIARDRSLMDSTIRWVEKFPGVSKVLDLPVEKTFKISAVFGADTPPEPFTPADENPFLPDNEDRRIIRTLQNGLPIVERPFLALAEEMNMDEIRLIDRVNAWLCEGIIRRFGARVNHRRMGYTHNVLAAWQGDAVDEWGAKFAAVPQVSHCYARKSYPEWPYRLYTMIHTHTGEEMEEALDAIQRIAAGSRFVKMQTLYELKKTSMKYFLES